MVVAYGAEEQPDDDTAEIDVDNKTFEIRVRQRDDLDPLLTAQNKRDDLDLFVRMTSKFTLLER